MACGEPTYTFFRVCVYLVKELAVGPGLFFYLPSPGPSSRRRLEAPVVIKSGYKSVQTRCGGRTKKERTMATESENLRVFEALQ